MPSAASLKKTPQRIGRGKGVGKGMRMRGSEFYSPSAATAGWIADPAAHVRRKFGRPPPLAKMEPNDNVKTSLAELTTPVGAVLDDEERKRKRAERFGTPIAADKAIAPLPPEEEAAAATTKTVEVPVAEADDVAEDEARKQRRLARFGTKQSLVIPAKTPDKDHVPSSDAPNAPEPTQQ